jgi:hypothetical protein
VKHIVNGRSPSEALANPLRLSEERNKALLEEAGLGWDDSTAQERIIRTINDAIKEGHARRKKFSTEQIIAMSSQLLRSQLEIKQIKSQQALGSALENLEQIKHADALSERRLSKAYLAGGETFNPIDYPIAFAHPLRMDGTSAWIEHIPFGMFMIDILRPRVLVELGTHTGVSYCAFCQAVKRLGLNTRCYAVDTWEGDMHAGYYGPEILADLRAHHDPLYGDFSRLVQGKFDAALMHFVDGSVDLLHIDGLHTYEDVRHDFEAWLPKLSDRAVVLFHDTNMRERDFGVWRLWLELSQRYRHLEFSHGHGLGVVQVGERPEPGLERLLSTTEDQSKQIREFFFALGSRFSAVREVEQLLSSQLSQRDEVIRAMNGSLSWRLTKPLRSGRDVLMRLVPPKRAPGSPGKAPLIHSPVTSRRVAPSRLLDQELPISSEFLTSSGPIQMSKNHKTYEVAVVFHLYYEDLFEETKHHLQKLNAFDLYVSMPSSNRAIADEILATFPHAKILLGENRGRDLLPFKLIYESIGLLNYAYLLKLHTKKSPHRDDGSSWRADAYNKLMGSPESIQSVIAGFESDPMLGIVGPKGHVVDYRTYVGENEQKTQELARRVGIIWKQDSFDFVAGSMFWARPEALRYLSVLPIEYGEFEAEPLGPDGSLVHALERFMCLGAHELKYKVCEVDEDGRISEPVPARLRPRYSFAEPKAAEGAS